MNPVEMKVLLKEVGKKYVDGNTKKSLYEEYKEKIDRDVLEKYLASKPDPHLKSKYKILNYVLLFCLISILVITNINKYIKHDDTLIHYLTLVPIALNCFFIFYICKMNPVMYRLIVFIKARSFFSSLDIIKTFSERPVFEIYSISSILILEIAVIIISTFLALKLYPYYGLLHPKMVDGKYLFTSDE